MCRSISSLVFSASLAIVSGVSARAEPVVLPTVSKGGVLFLRPVTLTGEPLLLALDTGTMGPWITEEAASRLALLPVPWGPEDAHAYGANIEPLEIPSFRSDASIPPHEASGNRIFPVHREDRDETRIDGCLGWSYLDGRVWTFDYPGRRILLRANGDLPEVGPAHRLALEFPDPEKCWGRYPSIRLEIGGRAMKMSIENGSAGCFLPSTRLQELAAEFPAWREDAEHLLVPELELGGYRVGPVRFEARPDQFFQSAAQGGPARNSSPSDGCLGAEALRFFRLTLDYVGKQAVFERP